ncbi:hypothetical protein J1P26_08370 [Neobacillus sp. MM2021_6]|uniref:hypothetical protein n=1 Tax=Bacillus sp. MM2020_4 TaxID=2714039 RepID=UPI0014096DD2|nr:hypothetical protein [Bacillus sp. MM2020_4]MBO0959736.1 hypothetical protein [Neobacillus sp. MM2021_6]NHC19184.1 hypothetical protein [Bacillus sp. MM2020_4]
MKYNKMFLLVIMLVPWLSLPLLGKKSFRRFYPGALFVCIWIACESLLAKKRIWWRFYEKLIPNVMGEIPFIIGPFFIGSIWILKFTFGNFFRYIVLNFVMDFLFVYPGMIALRNMGVVSLVRMKHYQMGILFMAKSVLMYVFQSFAEKLRKKPKNIIQKILS